MGHIAMMLGKPPYGDINAAEALRHALGAVSGEDWKVSLILVDGGVLLAKKGQDDTGTGFTNLETTLNDCVDMGMDVYADSLSLIEHSVSEGGLASGIRVGSESEIASILKSANKTMVF